MPPKEMSHKEKVESAPAIIESVSAKDTAKTAKQKPPENEFESLGFRIEDKRDVPVVMGALKRLNMKAGDLASATVNADSIRIITKRGSTFTIKREE